MEGKVDKISQRPSESTFIQQTLPTFTPILDSTTAAWVFFIIGILFIPIGVGIWFYADTIDEVKVPYTFCSSLHDPNYTCDYILQHWYHNVSRPLSEDIRPLCNCKVNFTLTESMEGPVYMYYEMTNFYQNRLRYYRSRDDYQLGGKIGELGNLYVPMDSCEPMRYDKGKIILPCGVLADSMFNDTLTLTYAGNSKMIDEDHNESVGLIRTGIAWTSDRERKFKNPDLFHNTRHPIWNEFTKPKSWNNSLWGLDPHNISNNGLVNEDFIVWMRSAALPSFRKMYRLIDHKEDTIFEKGLPAGNYILNVKYTYQVGSYGGTKSVILTNSKIVAAKNYFLAIVYMSTGGLCICLGSLFLFLRFYYANTSVISKLE